MKRIMILLAILPALAYAQEPIRRHEIGINVGVSYNPANHEYKKFWRGYVAKYDLRDRNAGTLDDDQDYTTFNIDYLYNINDRVAIGALAGYGNTREDKCRILFSDEPLLRYGFAAMKSEIIYAMPSVRLSWFRSDNRRLNMYSRMSLGAMRQKNWVSHTSAPELPTDKEYKWGIAGQITAFGIEGGGQLVKAYSEFGYGMNGIANIGIKFYFK